MKLSHLCVKKKISGQLKILRNGKSSEQILNARNVLIILIRNIKVMQSALIQFSLSVQDTDII